MDLTRTETRLAGVLYVFRVVEIGLFMSLMSIPLFGLILLIPAEDLVPNYWAPVAMAIGLVIFYVYSFFLRRCSRIAFVLLALHGVLAAAVAVIYHFSGDAYTLDGFVGLLFLFCVSLPLSFFGARALTIPGEQLTLLATRGTHPLTLVAVLEMCGVPKNAGLSPRRLTIIIYAFASTFFLVLALNGVLRSGLLAMQVLGVTSESHIRDPQFDDTMTIAVAVLAVAWIGFIVGFAYLSRVLERKALRMCRISLADAQKTDRRPPIVLLRSFRDDQVRLQPARVGFLNRLIRAERYLDHLDGLLIDEASPFGPVVALGRPGEQLPPFGAARTYATHEGWQSAVRNLAAQANALIISVDNAQGIFWELELVQREGLLEKTLFVFPPTVEMPSLLRALRNSGLRCIAELIESVDAPRDGEKIVTLLGSRSRGTCCVTSKQMSAVAYLVGVRHFLRTRFASATSSKSSVG